MLDERKSKARLIEELNHQRERTAQLERLLAEMDNSDTPSSERELRYRILSELTSDCCWVRWKGPDGSTRRMWVTDSFERVTGYAPEEFEAMGREKLVHPDDLAKIQDHIDGPFGVSEHEFRIIKKDGQTRHLRERMRVVTEGDNLCVYGATWDITDEKEALDALQRSEERTRRIIETAMDGVIMMDGDGRILDWNPQASDIFGWTRAQARSKRLIDLVDVAEVEERLGKPLGRLLEERDARFFQKRLELSGMDQTGRTFPVEMSLVPLDGAEKPLLSAFVRDLTSVKEVEMQKKALEAQMLHVQKLESLGVVAAGIAHDFNNFLTVIMGNTEMAQRIAPSDRLLQGRHAAIVEAADKASGLCRQLLTYAGKGDFEFKSIDVSQLIGDMDQLMGVCVSRAITLDLSLDESLPPIEGGTDQIRQVVLNLLTNASESMVTESGLITLRTWHQHCDADVFANCYLNDPLPEGEYVVLEVADTGGGIDPAIIRRIFDPFFTTKFLGRGLGLATVLGIVRSHRGAIEVVSRVDQGSTFRVFFPAFSAPDQLVIGEERVEHEEKAGLCILVIDDDEDVRDMCGGLLEDSGYQVLLAADGDEGCRILQRSHGRVDLVMLDLHMPGTSGIETLNEIKREFPKLPVIIMSGYSDGDRFPASSMEETVTFLQKPFRREPLLRQVSIMLAKSEEESGEKS